MKVITLCSSVKFMDKVFEIHEQLELEGNAVIGVTKPVKTTPYTSDEEDMLDRAHKKKIDLSDAIYVVNVGGYIGKSVRSEIEYAIATGKDILYLEKLVD